MTKFSASEKINGLISELDTAVGMLIVAAMTDVTVKEAMEKVSNVSVKLGEIAEALGD